MINEYSQKTWIGGNIDQQSPCLHNSIHIHAKSSTKMSEVEN